MKLASYLILFSLISCGSKNNIFYEASKSISETIGGILPAEAEPDFKILNPQKDSTNGQFVTLSGECSDTTKLEISNDQLAENPTTTSCSDEKFSVVLQFNNTTDIITELDVKAINQEKSVNKQLEIEVKIEKPAIAAHLDISYIRYDRAELAWSSSSSNELSLQGYELEYKKSRDTEWSKAFAELTQATTALITSLEPETEYEFRVRAFNGNYSAYSTVQDSTKPKVDFFEPGKIKAFNIGAATQSSLVAIEAGDFYLNGSLLASLQAGEVHKFTSQKFDKVSSDKAFFVAGIRKNSNSNVGKGNIVWTTQDWSSKKLNFAVSRSQAHLLSLVAYVDSKVQILKGDTVVEEFELTADTGKEVKLATNGSYTIQSSGEVSAFVISTRNRNYIEDPRPIVPASTDILGYPSRWGYISALLKDTKAEAIHSNDFTQSHLFADTGASWRIDSQGDKYLFNGEATRILSSTAIVANSNADRNGNCSAPFIPRAKLRNTYAINVDSEWIAFASVSQGTITVRKPDGTETKLELTRNGSNAQAPFKARLTKLPAGTIFSSTVPMGAWYEPRTDDHGANDDETILFGFNL